MTTHYLASRESQTSTFKRNYTVDGFLAAGLALALTSTVGCARFDASNEKIARLSVITCDTSAPCRAKLQWTDQSTNESGFQIERVEGLTETGFVLIGTTSENVENFDDTDIKVGTTYCYRVRAFNSETVSAYSGTACGQINSAGLLNLSL